MTDKIEAALKRAYLLGQTYWQQADSESYKQNRKADETQAKFEALVAETLALLREAAQPDTRKHCPGIPRKGCDYLAGCNEWCNKCGNTHQSCHLHYPANQPRPADEELRRDAGLLSALKALAREHVIVLEGGYDRIKSLGGDCDPVDVMVKNSRVLQSALAAIAAEEREES